MFVGFGLCVSVYVCVLGISTGIKNKERTTCSFFTGVFVNCMHSVRTAYALVCHLLLVRTNETKTMPPPRGTKQLLPIAENEYNY